MLGVFAAFLRDSIKRVTISGMMLSGMVLVKDVGLDTINKTHTDSPLYIR